MVLRSDDETVTRKLLDYVGHNETIGQWGAFSGWYFETPDEIHVPYDDVEIPTPVGPAPAWLVPSVQGAAHDDKNWAVVVHGRGTNRSETAPRAARAAGSGHHLAPRLVPQRRRRP